MIEGTTKIPGAATVELSKLGVPSVNPLIKINGKMIDPAKFEDWAKPDSRARFIDLTDAPLKIDGKRVKRVEESRRDGQKSFARRLADVSVTDISIRVTEQYYQNLLRI